MVRSLFASLCLAGILFPSVLLEAAEPWTLEVTLRGRPVQGQPLKWSSQQINLLGRDGYWWSFAPREVTAHRRAADTFRPYSQAEMRGVLLAEFGQRYEVSGTGHYLVVHPKGQRDQWASRFETLYRSYVHYFTARGMRPSSPAFPLVAVIFPTQGELLSYASRTGAPVQTGYLGVYSGQSNRILMYDYTSRPGQSGDWRVNAETIIHEATHQIASNCGQHNRFSFPPRWVVEGLATMFEAPGVWDSSHHTQLQQRINRQMLGEFRRNLTRRPQGYLAPFISQDRLFMANMSTSYPEAWALTFFLMEKRPRQYQQYLTRLGRRPDFQQVSSAEQLREFTACFGGNLQLLESHYLRFIAELP